MNPIAVFFHGLIDGPHAASVIEECLVPYYCSGLDQKAKEFKFCYNGPQNSAPRDILPRNAEVFCHGPLCFTENPSIDMLWRWCAAHPDWNVLYFHSKGASTPPGHEKYQLNKQWRQCMLTHLVHGWKSCVTALESGVEMVTCHWLTGQADGSQNIPAGNFLWVTSNFVKELPPLEKRDRIKVSGMFSRESRYEAEVFWGNGPRLPHVLDKHPAHPLCHK